MEVFTLDREKARTDLKPLRMLVRSLIETEFEVKEPRLTSPLVLSQIRPGQTGRNYSRPHVDLYSYQETLIHFTAVLYLHSTQLTGGNTHIRLGPSQTYSDKVRVVINICFPKERKISICLAIINVFQENLVLLTERTFHHPKESY